MADIFYIYLNQFDTFPSKYFKENLEILEMA